MNNRIRELPLLKYMINYNKGEVCEMNQTCEMGKTSLVDFFLVSRTQKYEYRAMPKMAIRMPIMFLAVKGSCSRV